MEPTIIPKQHLKITIGNVIKGFFNRRDILIELSELRINSIIIEDKKQQQLIDEKEYKKQKIANDLEISRIQKILNSKFMVGKK